jgi:hypothetical protein
MRNLMRSDADHFVFTAKMVCALCFLLLTGCAQKVVTIPGPEVVRLVPAKVDPRLLSCMNVDPPDPDLIQEDTPPSKVAAILGVVAQRYKMAWESCRDQLEAIRATQEQQ